MRVLVSVWEAQSETLHGFPEAPVPEPGGRRKLPDDAPLRPADVLPTSRRQREREVRREPTQPARWKQIHFKIVSGRRQKLCGNWRVSAQQPAISFRTVSQLPDQRHKCRHWPSGKI